MELKKIAWLVKFPFVLVRECCREVEYQWIMAGYERRNRRRRIHMHGRRTWMR